MITPESIDLASLPWLPLDAKSAFPRQPAIYFAIDAADKIQFFTPITLWSSIVNATT